MFLFEVHSPVVVCQPNSGLRSEKKRDAFNYPRLLLESSVLLHNISSDTSSLTRPETCKTPVGNGGEAKNKTDHVAFNLPVKKGVVTEVVGGTAR